MNKIGTWFEQGHLCLLLSLSQCCFSDWLSLKAVIYSSIFGFSNMASESDSDIIIEEDSTRNASLLAPQSPCSSTTSLSAKGVPSKDFFNFFFTAVKSVKVASTAKSTRFSTKHSGICSLCTRKEKEISHADSSQNFWSHILSKHSKNQVSVMIFDWLICLLTFDQQ